MEERTTQKPKTFRKAANQDSTQRAAVGRASQKAPIEPTPGCGSPVLRLRLDSMMAGPAQPHTNENSEVRGASTGYFGRLSSIPSRS